MRIFSAILLLGNIEFIEGTGLELDIIGNNGKELYDFDIYLPPNLIQYKNFVLI